MYGGACWLKYDLLEKLLGTAIKLHARYDIFKIATTFQVLHRILGLREIYSVQCLNEFVENKVYESMSIVLSTVFSKEL